MQGTPSSRRLHTTPPHAGLAGAEICNSPNRSLAGKVLCPPNPGSRTCIPPRLALPTLGTRCQLKPRVSHRQPAAPQSIPCSCLLHSRASPTLLPAPHASSTARHCQAAAASEAALSAEPPLPQPQHPRAVIDVYRSRSQAGNWAAFPSHRRTPASPGALCPHHSPSVWQEGPT